MFDPIREANKVISDYERIHDAVTKAIATATYKNNETFYQVNRPAPQELTEYKEAINRFYYLSIAIFLFVVSMLLFKML